MSMITYRFNASASVDETNTITNTFTEEHRKTMKELIVEEAHPELYGDSFETIEFDGFQLIDEDNISLDTKQLPTTKVVFQISRRGGGINDKEEKKLDTSLVTRGSLLGVPPGAVFKRGINNYIYITGQSRDKKYKKYKFTNRLVAVYKRKEGVTDRQVEDELSQLGVIFNPKSLPQVESKEYDIIDEGLRAIDNKWVVFTNEDEGYRLIKKRITPQCESVGIGKRKTTEMAMTILNAVSEDPVLPMTSEKAGEWIAGTDYKNIKDKVRYVVLSYDFVSKGQVDAVKLATKYPNEEVRVIVQCGIISGGIDQYTARLTKFWVDWFSNIGCFGKTLFGGADIVQKNLVLYGGVPQCTGEFDTQKVCLYVQDSTEGEYTQKLDGEQVYWS